MILEFFKGMNDLKENEIKKFIKKTKILLEKSPNLDEANTKAKIVRLFIEILGWDVLSTEVELEYDVELGKDEVDYALIAEGKPALFIEAKRSSTSISRKEVDQLKRYMRLEGVEWGAVFNGKVLIILRRRRETDKEIKVGKIGLEEFTKRLDLLEMLSKEAIRSGRSKEIAERIGRIKELIRKLEGKEKEELKQKIKDLFKRKIGEEVPTQTLDREIESLIQSIISKLSESVSRSTKAKVEGIKEVSRKELEDYQAGEVAVFPSKPPHEEEGMVRGSLFLKKYNAWGFVRIAKKPKYFALYVSSPDSEVKYFGKVKRIVEPEKKPEIFNKYKGWYEKGKKLVILEEGSLVKLKDPIPFKGSSIQGMIYTDLNKLIEADTTEDLW